MSTTPVTLDEKSLKLDDAQVAKLVASIDLSDPAVSVTYGTQTMTEIAQFADSMLGQVRAKDAGPMGELLTDLMNKVKDMDVDAISGKQDGFLQKIPLIGALFNKANKALTKYETLSGQIDGIVDHLESSMVGLLRDIEVLEQLYDRNAVFHNDLALHIAAGKERLTQAAEKELPQLKAAAEAENNTLAAQKVRDLQDSILRFERRLHDLELSRTITLQSAPQIRLIQSNDQALAEKIQASILTTIPIWKSQLVIALSLNNQRNAAATQKEVADTTNALLNKNAEMLEQSSLATAREVERSMVDMETLRNVHGRLIHTIEESLKIAAEARQQRIEASKELGVMEQELRTQLTTLADQATEQKNAATAPPAVTVTVHDEQPAAGAHAETEQA